MISQILDYWFINGNMKRWFKSGNIHDEEIKSQFWEILKKAENFELWNWVYTKDGYLAHIILLDQFSRHIYRNTPDAYKNDAYALFFMEYGLEKYLHLFSAIEKMFVLMPYQHTTNIYYQQKGCDLLHQLIQQEHNFNEKNILKNALKHQIGHLNVLQMFGRFPKRNLVLHRKSTLQEKKYIKNTQDLPY